MENLNSLNIVSSPLNKLSEKIDSVKSFVKASILWLWLATTTAQAGVEVDTNYVARFDLDGQTLVYDLSDKSNNPCDQFLETDPDLWMRCWDLAQEAEQKWLAMSETSLANSRTNLANSRTNLANSRTNLANSRTNLANSEANLKKSENSLANTYNEMRKEVVSQ